MTHDGDSGVDLALRGVYDVAVVDWMLPGRDGLAVCEAIRTARVPIGLLMLTARTQVEDRVAGCTTAPTITWANPSPSTS